MISDPEQETATRSVDIVLPIRNPAPWLHETLESLKAQTTTDWRLIAVLHGEPGDLPALIKSATPDANILSAPETATLSDVLNLGLWSSAAPFVARMDADDTAEPERLATQLRYLQEYPEVGLVCSPVRFINEVGDTIGTATKAQPSVLRGLRWKNVIAHPTVMVRREALEETGGYNSAARHAEDYELWLRLAARWQVVELTVPLLRYRIHGGQVTRTKAIPAASMAAVGRARRALAEARGESVLSARIRQIVWSTPQVVRSWRRSS